MLITSASNPKIKFLKSLKTKKGRQQSGCYLLEGKRAVLDAISHNVEFVCLIVREDLDVPEADCPVITTTKEIIATLSDVSAPEGIIAQVKIKDTGFDIKKTEGDVIVFLDRLQDAGNLGTIIRTCDAAGIKSVILSPETVEIFNPKTVRATMSSMFNVNIMQCDDSISTIKQIKSAGYSVLSATLSGEDFYSQTFDKKRCIVIGNEGNGICSEIVDISDKKIKLPMRGGAESLNASVAAGILIYGLTFER